ncbi:MAG: AEC family transporter [Planctomycetota bacterium]|jgi:predicted permease
MQPELLSVVSTVASVFLVIAVGALARKWKCLANDVDRSLAILTKSVLMPALFFHRIMTDPNVSMEFDAWIPAWYGFGCTAGGIGIAGWIAWSIGKRFEIRSDSQRRTFAFCAGIDNYGYIPFPIAEAFFPASVVTLMIFNVGVDTALWSIGLFVISGKGIRESWKRVVFSPPLLAVILAVSLRQLNIDAWVPQPFLQACQQLGKCSIPMGLILSGAIIYDYAEKFHWGRIWRPLMLAIAVRMLLLPLAILWLSTTTGSLELKQVLLVQAAMPAATFPIVMTRLYEQDIETAWTVVVGTSFLAILTIPLWLVMASHYWLPSPSG